MERVISLTVGKPAKEWSDGDSRYAQHKIMEYGYRLNELDKLRVYAAEYKLKNTRGEAVLISIKNSKNQGRDTVIYLENNMSPENKKNCLQRATEELAEQFVSNNTTAKSDRRTTSNKRLGGQK